MGASLRSVASALALLPLAACFQGQRTIRVNADGSGTIVDTLVAGDQMRAMMAVADKDKEKAHEKARLEAEAMGPGVTLVSDDRTPEGIKTTFAFKDVGQIKVGVSPGPESSDKSSGGSKEQTLVFRLSSQGSKSVLTVIQPRPARPDPPSDPAAPAGLQEMGMAMWTMMKPMMKGLKLKTVVEVEGKLTRTNSRYVQGSAVTLLEMDFDQIAADPANFKKFTSAGDDPSTLDPGRLQGVKGIKVNPDAEVVIEFTKGR